MCPRFDSAGRHFFGKGRIPHNLQRFNGFRHTITAVWTGFGLGRKCVEMWPVRPNLA